MAKRDSNFNPIGKSRGVRKQPGNTADWSNVNESSLRNAIAQAASTGGALRFGYSRDGGAYAVGIYGDGEPYTEFLRPGDDVELFLEEVIELFESIKIEQTKAEELKKRPM